MEEWLVGRLPEASQARAVLVAQINNKAVLYSRDVAEPEKTASAALVAYESVAALKPNGPHLLRINGAADTSCAIYSATVLSHCEMWIPRRRPRLSDSISTRNERQLRQRVTSDGSVIRQRVISGDSTSDLGGELLAASASDVFNDEHLVTGCSTKLQNSPDESSSGLSNYDAFLKATPEDRETLVTEFNNDTMRNFDEERWMF